MLSRPGTGAIQLGLGERDRLGRCHRRLADGFVRTNAGTNSYMCRCVRSCRRDADQIDGVTFLECYPQRRRASLGGLKINFIALPQLLKNRRATQRQKDRADVEALTAKQK